MSASRTTGSAARDGYREIAAHAALRPFVECLWVARGGAPARDVMPDGCVDFLFDRGPGSARLIGAMTRPLAVEAVREREIVAVRFRPGGAHAFAGAPLDGVTDDALELTLLGPAHRELAREVLGAAHGGEALRRLESWLLRRVPPRLDAIGRVLAALPHAAGFRVDALAAAAGVTRQHLARTVLARSGLSPKRLARILRLRGALAAAARLPLAAVAQRHGFADQAHLAREVRAITGRTPGQLGLGSRGARARTDGSDGPDGADGSA